MEKVSVSVKILDRTYRLTIAPEEERLLREAAAMIDAQARLFTKQYGQKDRQDLLSMVCLTRVTELLKIQENLQFKDNRLIEKLTEIDSVLEQNLHPTRNSL